MSGFWFVLFIISLMFEIISRGPPENDGYINKKLRHSLGYALLALSLSATLCMLFLRRTPWVRNRYVNVREALQNTFKCGPTALHLNQ